MDRRAPVDYAAFVGAHSDRLRTACQELTRHGQLGDLLAVDLLATVALRWRLWPRRRRTRAAAALLERLLRGERRTWRPPGPDRSTAGRIRVLLDPPVLDTPLAQRSWARARSMRRGRALTLVAVLALLGCIAVAGPRPPSPPALLPPVPTAAAPAGVRVLPSFTDLGNLPRRGTALPPSIDSTPISTVDLLAQPVRRAVAVLRSGAGPLIVVAEDASVRTVASSTLDGSQLLSTSLSPDGTQVALVSGTGLLMVDLTTGAVRPVAAPALQPRTPVLNWYAAHAVLLPGGADAVMVNVDSGAAGTITGVTGIDAFTRRGTKTSAGGPDELIPASASITLPPRIRIRNTTGYEDRPIFGPPWIGAWTGAGWSTSDILARPCAAGGITMPVGEARAAVGAVNANGLYAGTLVSTEIAALDVVGFVDATTVLVTASAATETDLLAWNPRTGTIQLVTTVSGYVRMSVPDLLTWSP